MLLRLSFFVLSPAFLFLFSLKKKKNNLGALLVLGLLNNLQLFYIYIYIYMHLFPLCSCCLQILLVCTSCFAMTCASSSLLCWGMFFVHLGTYKFFAHL